MATFPFELVSPTRLVFSGEVDQVDVPGADGDFGVLANHAPVIAALRPGILTIREGGNVRRLFVRDGFAEVNPASFTVIAEFAVLVEELDAGELQKEIAAAEVRQNEAKDGSARDQATERVGQLKRIAAELAGVTASAH